MRIGAAAEQEVAEFIARDMAVPVARRADPDAGLALAIRALVQQMPDVCDWPSIMVGMTPQSLKARIAGSTIWGAED